MISRLLDILLAAFALLVLSPLLLPVMVVLKLTGEHYIFYIQPRVGRHGQLFGMMKFATMLKESPNMDGGCITTRGDPRVLPIGRFLRMSKINELPQIFNVLVGHMAIVGPRPLTPGQFDFYNEDQRSQIVQVRPGITGIGSLIFRDEEAMTSAHSENPKTFYAEAIAPYKGDLEVWYANHKSLILDMKIVIFTAIAIIKPSFKILSRFHDLPEPPARLKPFLDD